MSLGPAENILMSTRPMEKTIAAPERLDLESRTGFRRAAGEVLDLLAEGAGRLVIDLSGTRSVDSAGLGALMLIQRKAAERRQTVCLRGPNEELRRPRHGGQYTSGDPCLQFEQVVQFCEHQQEPQLLVRSSQAHGLPALRGLALDQHQRA